MTAKPIIPAILLSAACAAALAAWPEGDAPTGDFTPARIAALPPPPSWQSPSVEDYPQIIERPLFSPSRRAPPKGTAETATPVKVPDGRLVGVVIGQGAKIALIEEGGATKAIRRLGEGQSFGGWKVSSIDTARVVLSHQDIVHALELVKPGVAAPTHKGNVGRANR